MLDNQPNKETHLEESSFLYTGLKENYFLY